MGFLGTVLTKRLIKLQVGLIPDRRVNRRDLCDLLCRKLLAQDVEANIDAVSAVACGVVVHHAGGLEARPAISVQKDVGCRAHGEPTRLLRAVSCLRVIALLNERFRLRSAEVSRKHLVNSIAASLLLASEVADVVAVALEVRLSDLRWAAQDFDGYAHAIESVHLRHFLDGLVSLLFAHVNTLPTLIELAVARAPSKRIADMLLALSKVGSRP